jgi:tRNA A-37 threonylcarbamoyl transferase component Bud32
MMRKEEKLRHASSRKLFLVRKKVVKFYPSVYGYLLHDLSLLIFSLLFFQAMTPISPKRKISNELKARKILSSFGIKTTKIKSFSFSKRFVEEDFDENSSTIDDLEVEDFERAFKAARKIGELTRKLNEKNFYFIDNRASNWMFNKNIIRTDLELFRESSKSKSFFVFCDILSFLSTVKSKEMKEEFLKGYGKRFKISGFLQFLVSIYIKLTDIVF